MGNHLSMIRKARRTLHRNMGGSALYYPWPLDGIVPRSITVRVFDKTESIGSVQGFNYRQSERVSESPKVIFMLSEIQPQKGFYVSFETGDCYRLDVSEPPDDITQTFRVSIVDKALAELMPKTDSNYLSVSVVLPKIGG